MRVKHTFVSEDEAERARRAEAALRRFVRRLGEITPEKESSGARRSK